MRSGFGFEIGFYTHYCFYQERIQRGAASCISDLLVQSRRERKKWRSRDKERINK
jgi:hypothetical protein